MSTLWQKLTDLIATGDVRISEHGYDALADDGLAIDEVLSGAPRAIVLEEYPTTRKAPQRSCCSWIQRAILCMRYGAFLAVTIVLPCW
jgi:hypothetical protein